MSAKDTPGGKPLFEVFLEEGKPPNLMKALRGGPYANKLPSVRVKHIITEFMQAIDARAKKAIKTGTEGGAAFGEALAWALKEVEAGN